MNGRYTIKQLSVDLERINGMARDAGIKHQLEANHRCGYVGLDYEGGAKTVTTGTAKHCYAKACEWLMFELHAKLVG